MNSAIRVGFVGMGKIGRIRFVEAGKFSEVHTVGFVDPDPTVAEKGLPRFDSPEQLIAQGKLDAVFISVPNLFTATLTELFLSQGIAVFAEKPPARRVTELLSLKSLLVTLESPTLMYGFNHRHNAGVKALLDKVRSRELGNPLWLRGRYGKEIEDSFYTNWRSDYSLAGGGILLDQGIHMVDLMREISGGFDEASSAISNRVTEIEGIEDNAFVIYRSLDTGITASLHSTMTQWRYLFSLEVFCEEGSLILNGLRTPSGNYGSEMLSVHSRTARGIDDTTETRFDTTVETSWATEMTTFFEALREKKQPDHGNIHEAIATLSLVEMAYDADPSFHRPNS